MKHVLFASAALLSCGGETHTAPVVVPVPVASASAPVAVVDAAAPEQAPAPLAIELVNQSVLVTLGKRDEVRIDAKSLKLPPALRAHLAHQGRDEDALAKLAERNWDAQGRAGGCAEPCRNADALGKAASLAQKNVDEALARYEAWAAPAVAELKAAVDAPAATVDVALALAAFLREDPLLHQRATMNYWFCTRSLSEDAALHPCGEDDHRLAHAFARAVELSTAKDALGAVARRGLAQAVPAKQARHALEEARDAATATEKGTVLAELAVAYAAGIEPDWAAAARTLRELRDVRDQEARAAAAKPKPPPLARRKVRPGGKWTGALGAMFGDTIGESRPTMSFSGADAASAGALLVFVELHAHEDAACVRAAADLATPGAKGIGIPGVVALVADAVERSDDTELSKAPEALQVSVQEELATRALYRGDTAEASFHATRASGFGNTPVSMSILAAVADYASLPEAASNAAPGAPWETVRSADDRVTAVGTRGGPERPVASLVRICVEPFSTAVAETACIRFVAHHGADGVSVDVGASRGVPEGVAECLRTRGPRVLAALSRGVSAEVGLRLPSMNGAGGLGLSGAGEGGGGRGEGIGLGNFGGLGHGAGTGTAQGTAPRPCRDDAKP